MSRCIHKSQITRRRGVSRDVALAISTASANRTHSTSIDDVAGRCCFGFGFDCAIYRDRVSAVIDCASNYG